MQTAAAAAPEAEEQPHSHPTLVKALIAAQRRAKAVAKKAHNKAHDYKYASADTIIDEANEALAMEGLAVFPVSIGRDPEQPDHVWQSLGEVDKEGNDASWISTPRRILAIYLLVHESGEEREFRSSTPVIPGKGRPEDKAEFGARTENLGYALRDLLLIAREDQAEQTPSARDDRDYQQRGPVSKPQPSAAPPQQRPAQQQTKPEVKTVGGPAPAMPSTPPAQQETKSSHGHDHAAAAGTIGAAPANETRLVRDEPMSPELGKTLSSLFGQLLPRVGKPMATKIAFDVTGKTSDSMTTEDGLKLKAHLEERIAKQGQQGAAS